MGNFTTVPDVTVGQSFPPSLWESAVMNNLNLGVCRQLADHICSIDEASITFASIPQTFAHLFLVAYCRDSDAGTGSDTLQAQFNGDTGANYDYRYFDNLNSFAQTSLRIGFVVPGGASANEFGVTFLILPNYTNTANHAAAVSLSYMKSSGSSLATDQPGGTWRNTAAITQILLQSSAGNLKAGSRITLYGLPA